MNPDELSPAVWAYIGDAVYELFIRERMLSSGLVKTRLLHHESTTRVRASFQAHLAQLLEPLLDEAEREILKRGRNVKSGHVPANTDVLTYRHSTAFEALIGYLYLNGRHDRLAELLEQVIVLESGPAEGGS
jgi:ribonuclease-3 family protein